MREDTIKKLQTTNVEFYQTFGEAFAETRRRIQPGVANALDEWISDGDWLDIGCGSGALAQAWIKRGIKGSYSGIDFSHPLLHEAEKLLMANPPHAELSVNFQHVDLLSENWTEHVQRSLFDGVTAFAVLHHIPGARVRANLLRQLAGLVKPGGLFIHSEWQFQHSPKLMARIQPWEKIGLREEDVEEGDALLDWRHQAAGAQRGHGLRYVHLFNQDELQQLADHCGFEIVNQFESDGAGERLGLYQVWRKSR